MESALDLFKEMFKSSAGSFGFIFALISFIIWVTVQITKVTEKYKVMDKIQESIDKIKDDLSEIKAFIRLFEQNNNPFAKTKSPISLTELGNKVSKELHIERIISKNCIEIGKRITAIIKKDSNPYNIQEAWFKIAKKYSTITSQEQYNFIRRYAFKNGYNLSDFDIIFGIIIRDQFFEKKGIPAFSK